MRPWHRHHWSESHRKVVRGALETGRGFKFDGGFWSGSVSDALYGYTLLEQRCDGCGWMRITKFTGAVETIGTGESRPSAQIGNLRREIDRQRRLA